MGLWTRLRREWALDGRGNASVIDADIVGASNSPVTPLDTTFNEYYSINGTVRSHDLNGNLTDDGTLTNDWDGMNRLVEVSDTSGTIVT